MLSKLVSAAILVLEGAFAIGVIGSLVVVLLTSVEDAKVLFAKEKPSPPVA